MSIKLGLEAKLFYKVDGQGGSGAWTELANVKEVTLDLETGEADVTTRSSGGWKQTVPTIKEASVQFELVWDPADTGFTAVREAYFKCGPIGLQIRDGTNGKGLQADFAIMNFSRSEPLEEAITVSVTAKVTHSATPPSWLEGGGS